MGLERQHTRPNQERMDAILRITAALGRTFTLDDVHPKLARIGTRTEFERAFYLLKLDGKIEFADAHVRGKPARYKLVEPEVLEIPTREAG